MNSVFSDYHPIVSFSYFTIIIIFTMIFKHPIFIGISLISAIVYALILNGKKALKLNILFGLPMFIMIAIANPIFSHKGATILFYLRGNPITLESIMYGIISASMMLSIIMWFNVYNVIITSDKLIYIFGRIMPSIALMISMTLRLIPKLVHQTKVITETQRTVGLDCNSGKLMVKVKSCMRVLSILVTWALEDAVQTADSMKARGYGYGKRTTFTIFKFTKQDGIMLSFIILVVIICFIGYGVGIGNLRFYPTMARIKFDKLSILMYIAFLIINSLPIFLELREEIKWKSLK
ncbi:energy-coupling factor transporter transmembrane component T [Hathewaya limosa]|uniref:Energy-coupling factor transport system permease protein n=1 Tax=Hathewaya limosa TaxID=1536 RepID=A0ABU0JY28_HATLI|nr:energy-coupling factor transporter transmembrane component T [Hathewaya limosa]MDQ0480837.1 energy-coupling factor transport system permease protein [Hathewaya limosa]